MSRGPRRLALATVVMLGLASLLLWFYSSLRWTVSTADFLRAEQGLSEAQVEELFGSPGRPVQFQPVAGQPDCYRLVLDCPGNHFVRADVARDPGTTIRLWPGNEVYWLVIFKDGVVKDKIGAVNPGLLKRLQWRFGW